ncbi:MAG: DUF3990 domain-containing protein [Clostridiales Family XIII bacterium]|jgi:hypothetical protein|nr:DUF3990 domain-containing protein [Clostridiales Family XIII bacterium]
MMLYHGSYTVVEKPDLSYSRRRTDFGKGFYLTPLKAQAESWAGRFLRERGSAAVSMYAFLPNPNDKLPAETNILEFDTHSLEWLDFITACRLGKPVDADWDLVIGGVANDKVFDTLQLYFDKLIGAEEAIGRLMYNKPNFQYCFKSQALIDGYLEYEDSEVLA